MRASIVIAAHNEGPLLLRTVESCVENTHGLAFEVMVADDASTDGAVKELLRRFPDVKVVHHPERRGCSATKDLGARKARGKVLVFLDGHCNPEPEAIPSLVRHVEELKGKAVLVPRLPTLHTETWQNSRIQVGTGFKMDLEKFQCGWIPTDEMRRRGRFFESPALIGCCAAMTRKLYERLWGFDRHMLEWGVEDIDFGLKAWLLGYAILHDPTISIGHRFRQSFDNFSVAEESVVVNQLRMARKNFTEVVWKDWVERCRARKPGKVWNKAWKHFSKGEESVEREREYLFQHRVRDEFAYAKRFGLEWPKGKDKKPRKAPLLKY